MKNSMLKFACIFIIVMYCLAPLSAIDLNQDDNNNKYINQEDNGMDMAVEDANINISDDENKSVVHDERNSAGNDEVLNLNDSKIEIENSKENLSEGRKQPNLRMNIEDVEQGQVPVLEVYADKDLIALDLPAYCPNFSNIPKFYEFDIHDGYGVCYLNQEKYLSPGNYTVTIDYTGTNLYYPQKVSTTFEVYAKPSANPNLEINVDDINVGEKANVDITANEKINGQVYVKLDASSSETPVMVKDGHGQVTLNDDLEAGTHTASVRYDGDRIFKADEKSTSFEVKRLTPKMSVSAEDIERFEQPTINVYTGIDKPINVTVQIYKDSTLITSSDESVDGYKSIQMDKNLTETGKYTVKLIFEGNEKYEACEKTTSFYVASEYEFADPKLNIKVDDITVGEKPTFDITTDDTLSGQVIVKLNHSGYCREQYVIVMDGHGQVTLNDDLEAGTYTVTARFEGNDIFRPSNKTTSFEVKKVNPLMSVYAKDIETGESPSINLQTSFKEPTKVKIQLYKDNKIITSNEVTVTNTQTIQMHEKIMDAGTYDVNVVFEGNKTHESAEAATSFNVSKKVPVDPNLSVKVNDITEGEKDVAVISANNNLNGEARVYLNNSNAVYPINIVNGSATVTIDDDLVPGDYLVTVSYSGDDTFKASESSTSFKVNKKVPVDPNLSIKVDDITEGEKAVAVISANNTLNGEARVYLNNSDAVYPINIVNGSATVTIDDDLVPGDYLVTVSYSGDDTFKASESSTTFKVNENVTELIDPNLTIKVNDITEGEKAIAEISAKRTFTGKVQVKLNDSRVVYNTTVLAGKGMFIINRDLAPGEYLATVSFAGNATHKESKNSTTFTVKEKAPDLIDPKLDIKVNNITYGEKATVTVSTDAGFTGNVDVEIGNTSYTVKVVNGKGTISVSGLKVGTYTAKATFKETDVYKASAKTTQFTVNKVAPKVIANCKSFNYFQKTKNYSVSLKDNKGNAMKGQKVILKVNGKTYSAKTNANGVATFKITKLNNLGIYNAVISYAGDENYNEASKNVLMIVSFLPFLQKT